MQAKTETGGYRASNMATFQFFLWTLAWLLTLALAKFGPELLWDEGQTVVSWAAIAANLVVGIGWIVAFARYLKAIDELQRKIQQDALLVTLGVAWVGGFAYVAADSAGLVAGDINVAVFPVLMSVVYLIAFAFGYFRYR